MLRLFTEMYSGIIMYAMAVYSHPVSVACLPGVIRGVVWLTRHKQGAWPRVECEMTFLSLRPLLIS